MLPGLGAGKSFKAKDDTLNEIEKCEGYPSTAQLSLLLSLPLMLWECSQNRIQKSKQRLEKLKTNSTIVFYNPYMSVEGCCPVDVVGDQCDAKDLLKGQEHYDNIIDFRGYNNFF